ncbi:class I adenylate-forming enzyme family protein [Halocatena pleomorpha]|uniref:2-succinylbenzoate--CoA ligase n=1 Tax=Halocatena pleomorpha TaxID=1785090 RepID=A0A3P3RCS5_9EURY|nr:AMP-binding protein [Halocatena pleomorpha]RRJ30263.1 2-succinylbenzoate--CoA ligase [Halocatena pleomorpha]
MRDWLSHRAVVSPDTTALTASTTGASETYAALDAAVEDLAARLTALGVTNGTLGIVLHSRPAAVRVVHAAMRVGAVVIPFGPDGTESEFTEQLKHADPDCLICEQATERLVTAVDPSVPVRSVDSGGQVRALTGEPRAPVDTPEWQFDDPLVMLFTSGTTGHPKLVVLTVGNVCMSAVASADRLGVLPTDRWCSPLGIHHMGGLAPIYRAVIDGTTLLLASTDPKPLLDALTEYEATGVSLVPVVLDRLLDAGTLPDSLRSVLLGGAPASEALIERCDDRGIPVYPTYGMTEAASQIATARPSEATATPGTVGRPLFLTTVTVVDSSGTPVSAGERGEIIVSGPTVTPGYYEDPQATAAAFCEFGFRTGDIGYLDADNRLWIEGRADDRIVTGGETVDPTEIVEVVCEHPAITDAAVVGVPDEEWGERIGVLLERSDAVEKQAIDAHCRSRLSSHKRPRIVAFGSIPRTASGTIDREAVRERLTASTT